MVFKRRGGGIDNGEDVMGGDGWREGEFDVGRLMMFFCGLGLFGRRMRLSNGNKVSSIIPMQKNSFKLNRIYIFIIESH